jgi:membrane fusion protein, multidrug efflux system
MALTQDISERRRGDEGMVRPTLDQQARVVPLGGGDERLEIRDDELRARLPVPVDRGPPMAPPKPAVGSDPAGHGSANQGRRGGFTRNPIVLILGALMLTAAMIAAYIYWDFSSHFETTDDAFIAARQFSVAPKVSGYIVAVPVTDNEHVAAGGVIAQIDDRDYRNALEQAEGQVAAANASIQNIDAQLAVQQAQIEQAQTQVAKAAAALTYAEQEATRYQTLASRGAGTVQQAQQTASTLRQDQASLDNAKAALTAAQRQIESLQAQRANAQASLTQAQAQRDQAQLNLSYTTVTAAQAGRVVNLTASVGEFAQAGTSLAMFVPDNIWVTANFKETQLDAMRPGDPVTMRIDAYPDRDIRGHVASVQPGSGTAFSLLPAENATGNYVKIVQRVPVKIVIDDSPTDVALGPGMSVVPSVRVDPKPSLYERIRGQL